MAAAATPSFSSSTPCNSTEFSLTMRYNDVYLALEAIDSIRPGTLNIIGMDPKVFRGTPVVQSGASPNAALYFNFNQEENCITTETGKFSIFVPDLGELYGQRFPITATKDQSWPHFFVGGDVQPQMTAASQMWYACNLTVQGENYIGLSWGVYNSNGSSPWGCVSTSVKQNFNIPCNA
ncbi:hypothetical protein LTR37_000059 [Vermiconidia calcicola]|uniref:Uncharacterized protein n=1 Tax=Vermiconidia calcicola TaxID=1690605 RepID=A0ACC3NZC5_9PEZI|nr:hypothetical protein LTR37_000059 [Vermiconidia calcicola]